MKANHKSRKKHDLCKGLPLIIGMSLSGFLFLFILVLNLAMTAFGHKIEIGDSDSEAELQKINNDPKKFRISIVLALIEHGSIIALTIMLFVVFSPYNLILGVVWTIFRIGEGLIQFYNEKNYWGLLNIARQYSGTSGAEKNSLSDLARTTFRTKDSRFKFAMICWSIGTLAYSIVFVTYGAVPQIIGWLGIVASILVGFGNGIQLAVWKREGDVVLTKPSFKVLTIGGLSAILFEAILGGWLLFYSIV